MQLKLLPFGLLVGSIALFGAGCGTSTKNAAIPSGGAYVSHDNGETWTQMSNYIGGLNITKVTPFKVIVDPFNTKKLYMAGGPSGLLFFDATKGEWNKIETPTTNVNGVLIHPRNPNILFIFGNSKLIPQRSKIWKSFDGGTTWAEIYSDPIVKTGGVFTSKNAPANITSLDIDPAKPEILMVGSSSGAFLVSRDNGATWNNAHSFNFGVAGVKAAPNEGGWWVLLQNGILANSTDDGQTFNVVSIKNKDVSAGTVLAVQFSKSNEKESKILAGTDRGVFQSTDNGKTWSSVSMPITDKQSVSVNTIALSNGEIYAGSGFLFYSSKANGTKWKVFQFPILNSIRFLVTDPEDPNTVYAFFSPV
jgi:photosystem II stability/assembly factor-like uncharacterized protein